MLIKVLLKEIKAVTMDLKTMALVILVPFAFWFLPKMNSGSFPAVLVIYIVLSVSLKD